MTSPIEEIDVQCPRAPPFSPSGFESQSTCRLGKNGLMKKSMRRHRCHARGEQIDCRVQVRLSLACFQRSRRSKLCAYTFERPK